MNRRQRKKAFKKIFGMSPEQYEKWYRENWSEIISEAIQRNTDALNKGLKEFKKEMADAIEIVKMVIDRWAEEIRAAAGFIETDNMISRSSPMPEGTDKNLLKHIGIRMDRYGSAYDFYYDEANEEYFMEILQEGEKKDGKNGIDP